MNSDLDDETEDNKVIFNGISWPRSCWESGERRSAFQPYRPTTVLTNFQRGNTTTEASPREASQVSWFHKAGCGDIVSSDISSTSNIDITDENGLTALMWSSAYGQTPCVELLIKNGARVNFTGTKGQTPLHLAAAGGHHDTVKMLLRHRAQVNAQDSEGNTPLMYAVFGDYVRAIHELLVEGADLTLPNFDGSTPFVMATMSNSYGAQLLLESHIVGLVETHISQKAKSEIKSAD